MSAAREKLGEAEYLLCCMRDTQSDREAFKYNLSAFVTASRSVREFLRREYEVVPGFKSWWDSKKEWIGVKKKQRETYADIKPKLFAITDPVHAANAFFAEARNLTIHERSVQPRAHIDATVTSTVHVTSGVSGAVVRADGTEGKTFSEGPARSPEHSDGAVSASWRWYFKDLPPVVDAQQKDVLTLSEEYLGRLEAFVVECETKF